MRRALTIATLLGLLAATPASAASGFPETIPLPDGFAPEGIAVGSGTTFYAGSLAGGGIYRGDLRSGAGDVLAPSDGRTFVGMDVDHHGRLWVSGGPDGAGYVIDADSGATLASWSFTAEDSFVNDVVVTREAAWFTDSFRPVIYRVSLAPDGSMGAVQEIDLSGQIAFFPGAFNLNGIDATPDGGTLLTVSSAAQTVYAIDVRTMEVDEVQLGEALPAGDGILLHSRTLYVVQNQLNQVAVVELRAGLRSGMVVGTLTDEDLDVPTTIARFGSHLYAVNARFGTPVTPDTEYDVVKIATR